MMWCYGIHFAVPRIVVELTRMPRRGQTLCAGRQFRRALGYRSSRFGIVVVVVVVVIIVVVARTVIVVVIARTVVIVVVQGIARRSCRYCCCRTVKMHSLLRGRIRRDHVLRARVRQMPLASRLL